MDNTDVPVIDLNIDPNMIAAQDAPPQTTPSIPNIPPVSHPGTIDITPGSTDTFPADTPASNHIDVVPLSEPKTMDITPALSTSESPSQPSTLAPAPAPAPEVNEPVVENPPTSLPPVVQPPVSATPEVSVQATTPVTQIQPASPLAENPDLVKLIK